MHIMSNGKYKIELVPPSELNNASYEPDKRILPNMALNKLKDSIDKIGLQYPPLVTRRNGKDNGYSVVDGHRRIAAMVALEYTSIPVIVTESGSADELFAAVSGTVKQLNAAEWLEVYLKGGILPGGATKTNIRRLDEVMGRDFLWVLHKEGMRPSIWLLAGRALKYIGLTDNLDNKRKMLIWISGHKITQAVNAWMTGSNSVEGLRSAFTGNRPPAMI